MKFGTTISLDEKDLERLNYIAEKCNYVSPGKGMTGIVRLAIQKAFAHQQIIEMQVKEPIKEIKQEKLENGDKRKVW